MKSHNQFLVKKIRFSIPMLFVVILLSCSLVGCGGSSDSREIDFSGTVTSAAAASRVFQTSTQMGPGVPNVRVCTLDGCSTTDDAGQWAFTARCGTFNGEDIEFYFEAEGMNTAAVVSGLMPGVQSARIDFVLGSDGTITAANVDQTPGVVEGSTSQ